MLTARARVIPHSQVVVARRLQSRLFSRLTHFLLPLTSSSSSSCLTPPNSHLPTTATINLPTLLFPQSWAIMFARAVNNDGKCKQTKPTTPALANPSVPKKTQLSLDDTIQSQSSVPASARRSNALTPSQPSVLNEPPRPEPTLSRQPVEQRDRLTNALNRQYSFGDCLSPPMVKGNLQTPQKPIDALHGAIDFVEEEYEFKDDLDEIDPELMGQVLASCVPSATSSFERPGYKATSPISAKQVATSPKKVSQQMCPILDPPSSSAPFPWSSSPAEHYAPPVLPVKRREPPVHTIPEEQNEDATIPPEEDCRPIKRRLLPWSKDGLKKESPMEQARPTKAPTEQASPLKAPTEQARPSKAPMQQARPSKAPTSRVSASRATNKKEKAPETWINSFANADHRTLQKELRVKNSVQKRTFSSVADPQEAALIKKKNIRPASIFLSDEQRHVLNLVQIGRKSVFFTGSAGTGKSVLLREIIADLRRKYSSEEGRVAVTASTGLAACNIGGVTLHSFAGIGLGKEPVPDLVRKIKRNIKAKNRWLRTKVLVIDEISMVDGDLFDKLEQIARQIRNNGRVFGGIQLVITGDFFQLPPVPEGKKVAKFAFDADSWTLAIEHTIGLSHVFRQKDPVFAGMLNEMRLGKLSANTINNFKSLHRPIGYNDGLEATELFPTRQEVDAANNSRLRKLTGEVQTFIADDSGTVTDPQFREKLLSNCMAPPKIELKINSQVMLIKNMDDSLVNGSLGRVVAFMDDRTFDLMFEGTGETDPDEEETKAAPIGKAKLSTAKIWPLVQFSLPDGTTRQLLVQPEQWKIELPNGEVQACRTQIPLILAWALSIHKAQGQTLERVKVDLGRVFEKGQAYVALSRATCQEGLQVLRFDEKKVMAHEKVRGFYSSLSTAKEALKTSSTRASSITTTATSSFRTAKSSATSQEMDESQVMREMHG